MDLDNSFSLDEMMKTAKSQMIKIRERLDFIDNTASEHLGGRSRAGLVGAVLVSLLWAAAFLAAYHYLGHYIPELSGFPLGLLLLGVSLALVAFVMIGNLVQLKYYGTILNARRRLSRLSSRITKDQKALPGNLKVFLERHDAKWELPLKVGDSIDQEASRIASRLSGMEALSSGFIAKFKLFLYYVACLVWASVGGYTIVELTGGMDGTVTDTILVVVLTVITCIIEVLIAKVTWDVTGEDVGNGTLLALFLGPVIFFVVVIIAVIVIGLVQAVFSNLGESLAIIVGIACVIGTTTND